jgi:PIN domain nuclease of toxin-antitoxin system
MKDFVVDTHAVVWYLSGSKRLSRKARTVFQMLTTDASIQTSRPIKTVW